MEIPESLIVHQHRLAGALLNTEILGVSVDLEYLSRLGVTIKERIDQLIPEMREAAGIWTELIEMEMWESELAKRVSEKGKANVQKPEFSFDSSKQLINLFYNKLGLPAQRNEKTKSISVDEASLEKLKDLHPLIPKLMEYRGHHKVYGAYIEGTLERLQDERIYPEFRVAGTFTGRISHSNPNLGQLPRTGGVRGIYRPDPGYVFISADYSQLEVNLEANLTGDTQLAKIFQEGLSKHDITAEALKIDRSAAKTLNFALQYWATDSKVTKLLGVTKAEGTRIWHDYWRLYSGPKRFKDITDKLVDEGKPIVTMFGRKRRFGIRKRSPWDKEYRQAYNFFIQSPGADLTSMAFYEVDQKLKETGWGKGMFTVHDEIMIMVRESVAPEAQELLLATMVGVGHKMGLKIPLKAEASGPCSRWED